MIWGYACLEFTCVAGAAPLKHAGKLRGEARWRGMCFLVLQGATRHTSHVTRHTSHVTRHTSHVTRHTSHVTRHTSHFSGAILSLPLTEPAY
jgi:hypothetical protein